MSWEAVEKNLVEYVSRESPNGRENDVVVVNSLLDSFALDFHCFHEFAEVLNLYFYFLELK